MKEVIFIILSTLLSINVFSQEETKEPENWSIAEKGLKLFEDKKYKEAVKQFEEAVQFIQEFPDEDKAKVYYHYAKSIQHTSSQNSFQDKVKLYKAFHEAANYGSGEYKKESELHLDDFRTVVEKGYYEEVDKVETGELSKSEVELVIWAAELLGFNDDAQQFKAYLGGME